MARTGLKKALAEAGLSKADFARATKLSTSTVYAWGDSAPLWAFEFMAVLTDLKEARHKIHVLERMNHSLILGEPRI